MDNVKIVDPNEAEIVFVNNPFAKRITTEYVINAIDGHLWDDNLTLQERNGNKAFIMPREGQWDCWNVGKLIDNKGEIRYYKLTNEALEDFFIAGFTSI